MQDLLFRLATALAIGLIVGVERGWQTRDQPGGSRTAGVRTFALSGLMGGVFAELAQRLESPLVLATGFIVFALAFGAFTWRELQRRREFSVTGLVAALLVFALGAFAVVGDSHLAGAAAIAVTGLLASRSMLHGLVRRLTWVELRSALVLLAMTVIVLPLLPDRTIDPLNAINPREIWLFTVLTAAISYAGYVAVKVAGPQRGILFGALAGALVSSTAVTIVFARRAASGEPAALLAGGACLAAMISILRVLILLALLAPSVLAQVAAPAGLAAIIFAASGFWFMRKAGDRVPKATRLGNPFDLKPLLVFAAGFAGVAVLSAWLLRASGAGSLLLVSALTGLADVDVSTLNAARLAGNGITFVEAAQAVLAGLGVNALARAAYGAGAGPPAFALRLAVPTAIAVAAAGALVLVT
ncbi:DUF4010 domain-containing protein [Xanthobacter sp. DSM 24535]|uniref:MgtC/SapB family protein n=1 Tax=Roseixanthobacter psychrophilus TaxID=3119917 RepID=UPI003726B9B3